MGLQPFLLGLGDMFSPLSLEPHNHAWVHLLAWVATLVVVTLAIMFWPRLAGPNYDLYKIPSPPGVPILGHVFQMALR